MLLTISFKGRCILVESKTTVTLGVGSTQDPKLHCCLISQKLIYLNRSIIIN